MSRQTAQPQKMLKYRILGGTVQTYNIALIGFGGVNRALAELIQERFSEPTEALGFGLRIVAITDLQLGTWQNDDGIDPAVALAVERGGNFAAFPGGSADVDNERVIKESSADIVVEATFTNPTTGEPAASHVRWALEAGKHVSTTNKGPVALFGPEFRQLADEHGVRFEYEGSVLSGTPSLKLVTQSLRGLNITGFEGILNGTSNFVLGQMAAGLSMADAVHEAQELGYAEADPTADLGGSDVALKVQILANDVLGGSLTPADVSVQGIQDLDAAAVSEAVAAGGAIKLIGAATRNADGSIDASVRPVALAGDHALASIQGATNAIAFHTDLLGTVTISGPGAGRIETAYALLADIIAIDDARRLAGGTS